MSARRYGARAHRKLASALLSRNSNAQHRSQFENKRSHGRLGLCCSRCFRFCHALVLALCTPAHPQAGALPLWFRRPAHRLQATAPLTRTTRRSSMPHPAATIPRFVCALLAVSASPSTPAAGTPLRSLTAEHAAARSPTALEGPSTRATHRYQLLLCPGHTARTPLRIAARALLALVRQAQSSTPIPPILPFNRLSSPCAIAK